MPLKIANTTAAMTLMIKFIEVWQNAETITEVQEAYNITRYCAYNYKAALEKQAGVRLKNFRRTSASRLSEGAMEILKQAANEHYLNYIKRKNTQHEKHGE